MKSQTRLSNLTLTFHFHALEKEMATHSSVLAWRIPGMAEPGGLPSMGSHRVGHDWSNSAAAAEPFQNIQCSGPQGALLASVYPANPWNTKGNLNSVLPPTENGTHILKQVGWKTFGSKKGILGQMFSLIQSDIISYCKRLVWSCGVSDGVLLLLPH